MQRNTEQGRKSGRRLMASIVLILLGVVVPGAVIAQQSGPPSTGGFPGGAAGPATGGGAQPQPEAVPNVTGGSQGSSQGAPLVSGPLTNVRQQRQESSSEKPRTQESIKKDAAASPKQTAKKAKSNGKWSVQVSPGPPLLVTVKKADDVPIADLAAQISKKSKIPFVLSDLVRDQLTTADFADLPFEAAVKYFAPSGFIDYSMKADYSEPPKPLLVYLCGINEKLTDENAAIVHREQAKDAAAKGFHQNLIVVSGDTETPTENPDWKRKQELFDSGQFEKLEEENPIKVSFTDGRVTVNAQKQSLMAVINAIAAKADIEANIDGFADATNPLQDVLVTIDKKNATLEEVLMSLSPYIVLHVRTDLETSISKPIRIILVAPKPYAVPVAEDSARTK